MRPILFVALALTATLTVSASAAPEATPWSCDARPWTYHRDRAESIADRVFDPREWRDETPWDGLRPALRHHRDCILRAQKRAHVRHYVRDARAEFAEHRDAMEARQRFTPYGRWAIPAYIVQCESGGRNLAPNSASASGYYQIISSTWSAYGGGEYAAAAYLATKGEQDRIAYAIWDGGSGASQWDCA